MRKPRIHEQKAQHGVQFIPARDSRNRRIAGLSTQGGRYYGRIRCETGDGRKTARRLPLFDDDRQPIRTLNDARVAFFADAFAALNGHPSQRLIDPNVNLAEITKSRWILPWETQLFTHSVATNRSVSRQAEE